MKLGLQGVTVVISSGDSGVGSFAGDPSPSGCAGPKETVFYPHIDASCPYLLTVGSTQLVKIPGNSSTPKYKESSTTDFGSGGGFSNFFDAPSWQKDSVSTYFKSVRLNFTGYTDPGVNFSTVGSGVCEFSDTFRSFSIGAIELMENIDKIGGRGYPDVAAIGDSYVVRAQQTFGLIGGTSLSAPIWAAIITRINEERIAANKSTVGFITPTLVSTWNPRVSRLRGSSPLERTLWSSSSPWLIILPVCPPRGIHRYYQRVKPKLWDNGILVSLQKKLCTPGLC